MMRFAAVAVGIIGLVVAVVLLRDATLSTHEPVDPDSRIELIIKVSTRDGEQGQTVEEMAQAQLLACRLEVGSDPVGPLEPLGEGRVRVVLTPSMDSTDQRQFRGCLEDWTIDHVRTDVERLTELG
jgi:hypothetical protein